VTVSDGSDWRPARATGNDPPMTSPFVRALMSGIAFASVIWIVGQTRTDVDIWGHVRFGLEILDARALHETDQYSFTSDRPWINHEWLSEVVFGAAWRAGGTPGLILVKLACAFGTLALVAGTLKQRGISGHPRLMLLGLTLIGILPRIAQVRPQIFSVVLFAALIRVFVYSEVRGTGALLWTIPIVVIWTNVHGGWLVGLGTVGLWCAGEAYALRTQRNRAVFALTCAAAAAMATLLNPYGVGLWQFLLETVRFGREGIREWGPVWSEPTTILVWGLFALVIVAALRRTTRPRNPATVIIPIVWGLLAFRVNRLDAFFALSVIGLLAEPVASFFRRRSSERDPLPRVWRAGGVAAALAVMLAVPMSRRAFTCIGFYTPRWPEPQVIEFMHNRQLSGRMVTDFNWGEYGIWHMPRSVKISMDGRRETVYTDRTVTGHLRFYTGTDEGLEYLQELDADYIWLPRWFPVLPLLEERGWIPIFEGPRSTVLARPGAAADANPPAIVTEEPPARCFPGP